MTSFETRRRRDVKSQDREKSMSPLDKDQLKRRCLERVRTERSRLMARMRGRKGAEEELRKLSGHAGGDSGSPLTAAAAAAAQGENMSSPAGQNSLSSAREILRQGLSELSGGNGTTNKRRRQQHHRTNHERTALGYEDVGASPARSDSSGGGRQQQQQQQQQQQHAGGGETSSFLSAIEEENASYLNACARGQEGSLQQRRPRENSGSAAAAGLVPMFTSLREQTQGFVEGNNDDDGDHMAHDGGDAQQPRQPPQQQQQQQQQQQPEAMVDEDELGWGDGDGAKDYCDEENLLSPDEYLEMMDFIDEACREENRRAEAALLEDYERTRRLEEEAVECAVASFDDINGNGQDDAVLCPVCKRDYLLHPGPPSASIVCACGFRLDTGGDRLGLEQLKQQLADTYMEHSTACSAEPSFMVEGAPGFDVLWSSCDGCGFARVVL